MVIGGQAALMYGVIRLTEDIDITLGVNVDKLTQIKQIFRQIGLVIPKNVDDNFIKKTNVLIGIDKSTGIRVDFIFSFTPYEQRAIKRAKSINIEGVKVKFVSLEDLIIHKLFGKRERDIEDVKIILAKYISKIDIRYIRKNLKSFTSLNGYENIVEQFNLFLKDVKKRNERIQII